MKKRKGEGVPPEERCLAMASQTGERCPYRRTSEKLCARHVLAGAVVPDEWTPSGLPVFYRG